MLAGIKPTVGRISRYGVIPITADQDTAGPMAKTVTDAAIMLGALESAAPDPNDPATKTCTPPPGRDYTRFLKTDGLKGARIGIPRAFFYDKITPPGKKEGRGGLNPEQAKVMAEAIAILKAARRDHRRSGRHPQRRQPGSGQEFPAVGQCSGTTDAKGKDADCSVVLKYGMKRDFNKWLASLGPSAPVKIAHRAARMEHHAHQGRRHQLRPVEPRYLRRNGCARRTAHAMKPIAPRTSPSAARTASTR